MNIYMVWVMLHTLALPILLPCMYVDLRAATIQSAAVIRLNPPRVKVKWSHQRIDNAPSPTSFEVVATNSSTTQRETVGDPRINQAELELRHDTTYSLKVITTYGASTPLESKEMKFKTLSEDEGLCSFAWAMWNVKTCSVHL